MTYNVFSGTLNPTQSTCVFSEPRAAHFRHAFQIRTKANSCVKYDRHRISDR